MSLVIFKLRKCWFWVLNIMGCGFCLPFVFPFPRLGEKVKDFGFANCDFSKIKDHLEPKGPIICKIYKGEKVWT